MAVYNNMYTKICQYEERRNKIAMQKVNYVPEGEEAEFFKKKERITWKIEPVYEECNKTRATVEFYSYAEPPDYIYYIGEVIGEITCQIPLRTPSIVDETRTVQKLSKEERWKEIRTMFYDPQVILNMYEQLNTNNLTEDHFLSLNRLNLFHQYAIKRAI